MLFPSVLLFSRVLRSLYILEGAWLLKKEELRVIPVENGEPEFWGTHGVQMQGAGGLGLGLRTGRLATQAPGASIQLLPESCH